MATASVLPFHAFLDLLHAKGYGVGVGEYRALAHLLDRWDRTRSSELGDAIAALVGRSDEEVRGIRRLFDEIYGPPPSLPPPPRPTSRSHPWLVLFRHRIWALALTGAVLCVTAAVWVFTRPHPVTGAPPVFVPPIETVNAGEIVTLPPPPAPPLPEPPIRLELRVLAGIVGGGFLGSLALFWALKTRERRRIWLREAWSSVRASLPGPYSFRQVVRQSPLNLPRSVLEDAATILGRMFTPSARARELDVLRTLQATLRRGLVPTFRFKPRRLPLPILIFQDVSQDMKLWEPKVSAFLHDLRRQGIALDRWYFDGDVRRVSDRRHRSRAALETVLRVRADSPVLIIGAGAGMAAAVASSDRTWMNALRDRPQKAWLTPVADTSLWPRAFEALPLDVWPMTRLGLTKASLQLAGLEREVSEEARVRVMEEVQVTPENVERLKRLASLVPHPSPALLELLRRRFGPDIPDSTVLHLLGPWEAPGAPLVKLDDGELKRLLSDIRRENPELERLARKTILDVLLDSEPAAGSAAHERWQINVAVQRLQLADLDDARDEMAAAASALQILSRGPMWEEVQDALRIVAATPTMTRHVAKLEKQDNLGAIPPGDDVRLASGEPLPWSWPGIREVVPAAAMTAFFIVAGLLFNALPSRALEHLQDAYQLDYSEIPSRARPQLQIRRNNASAPGTVDLYQDDAVFRRNIPLTEGAPVTIQLESDQTGHFYRVRARLSEGNLAASRAVWVTSDQLSYVLIDVSPWANVTIRSGDRVMPTQQTPFTAALLPGTYQLRFENPGLNPPSVDRTLTVPVQNNRLYFPMPGFDATKTVDELLRPLPTPQ